MFFDFKFQADGFTPVGALIEGKDGNFYGVTAAGGQGFGEENESGPGTVFQLTPTGMETVLHYFSSSGGDGQDPQAKLIQGTDGALYGTTLVGGKANEGTIFKVATSGAYTLLYSFSGADGASPEGTLLQGPDGDFYGTASRGGAYGGGTLFKITSSGILTTLYSFGAIHLARPRDNPRPTESFRLGDWSWIAPETSTGA